MALVSTTSRLPKAGVGSLWFLFPAAPGNRYADVPMFYSAPKISSLEDTCLHYNYPFRKTNETPYARVAVSRMSGSDTRGWVVFWKFYGSVLAFDVSLGWTHRNPNALFGLSKINSPIAI